jgi:hypothetical protein
VAKDVSAKHFRIAERALIDNIDLLGRLSGLNPQQAQMHEKLKQSLRDLGGAIRRMVLDRCKVRERATVC